MAGQACSHDTTRATTHEFARNVLAGCWGPNEKRARHEPLHFNCDNANTLRMGRGSSRWQYAIAEGIHLRVAVAAASVFSDRSDIHMLNKLSGQRQAKHWCCPGF